VTLFVRDRLSAQVFANEVVTVVLSDALANSVPASIVAVTDVETSTVISVVEVTVFSIV
jgi:hypothetical protein